VVGLLQPLVAALATTTDTFRAGWRHRRIETHAESLGLACAQEDRLGILAMDIPGIPDEMHGRSCRDEL